MPKRPNSPNNSGSNTTRGRGRGRPRNSGSITSESKKTKGFAFLGDSSAAEDEDQSATEETFRSPELDVEQTDYGFDYSRNGSVHQQSARNKVTKPAREEARKSFDTPRSTRQSSKEPDQRTSKTPDPSQGRIFLPQNDTPHSQAARSPARKNVRKQKTPRQRERILWNQIKSLQNRPDNITPKAPFGRLIRELLAKYSSEANRITLKALEALQISSEIYLTHLFTDAYVCTLHRGRVTLGVHDVRLVRFLRGPSDAGNQH